MAKRNNSDSDADLTGLRDRLVRMTRRVREHSKDDTPLVHVKERTNGRSRNASGEVSMTAIHEKLKAIDSYFRERIEGAPPVAADVSVPPPVSESRHKEIPSKPGVGIHVGTSYIVAARAGKNGRTTTKGVHNAFLPVHSDKVAQDLLIKHKIECVTLNDKTYVLGKAALDLASTLRREPRRTVRQGILNPSEEDSIPLIRILLRNVLRKPRTDGEPCCLAIPATPIDRDQDVIYHHGVLDGILNDFGFRTIVIDEGYAVVLAELESKNYTGIGIHCGGGMVNICASYRAVPVTSFSISRGGDWVDNRVAVALGRPACRIMAVKEAGISLNRPIGREQEAIAIYYRHFIRYFLRSMAEEFRQDTRAPRFTEPIDIIFAGGSTVVGDFLHVAREELKSLDLGFPVGDVRHAADPFTSASRGCLLSAMSFPARRRTEALK